MTLLRQAVAVAAKDLLIEVRGRHGLAVVLPFAATLLVAFGLSLGPGRGLLQETAPGLLWLALLFASILSVRQSYRAESEDGALEGLVLASMDKAAVFLGKAAATAAALLILALLMVLLVSGAFDLSLTRDPAVLSAALILGVVGLVSVSSLFGMMNETPRSREAAFPLLVLPLVTPVVMAGVRATALAAAGRGPEAGSWLLLLVAFDAVLLAAGTLVFGLLLED